MLTKKFIAPAIFMLLLAAGYLGTTGYFIFTQLGSPYFENPDLFWLALTFFWPVLMLVEAFLYWRIRKTNKLRKASWAHVVLMAYAFVSFFIKGWIFQLYDSFTPDINVSKFIRVVTLVHLLLFWVAVIGAHIFFIRVLIKARAQKHVQPTVDPLNLLDDVFTGD